MRNPAGRSGCRVFCFQVRGSAGDPRNFTRAGEAGDGMVGGSPPVTVGILAHVGECSRVLNLIWTKHLRTSLETSHEDCVVRRFCFACP